MAQHIDDGFWILKDCSEQHIFGTVKFVMETSELKQRRLQSQLDGTF